MVHGYRYHANYKLGGAQQHDSVRLDPWVFMFSAGYRF
ncbi:outer membrane protein W [Escherichia coli O157:H7 str. LSU-61]|nr:outer membrane protein W [Escherichia coli O157:H7 str. G5101]EFX31152.1 outer membrane protein W [Escherichia coli O157:H7 str. LSU-61]